MPSIVPEATAATGADASCELESRGAVWTVGSNGNVRQPAQRAQLVVHQSEEIDAIDAKNVPAGR